MGNKNYCVYKLTSPEGKSYIGVTGRALKTRWANGKKYHNCRAIEEAINRFGWDSFKKELLESGLERDEAYEREHYWVTYFKSNEKEHGYNLTNGGIRGDIHFEETKKRIARQHIGTKASEETKKLLSEIAKNRLPMSQETKDKLSKANKGRKLNLTPEQRQKRSEHSRALVLSEESRRKIGQSEIGNTYRRIPIMCVETGEVFETQYDASLSLGLSKNAIAASLHYGCKCGGYHWKQLKQNRTEEGEKTT